VTRDTTIAIGYNPALSFAHCGNLEEQSVLDPADRASIERMPKAELHVHLEGSVRPQTLLELGKLHGVTYPFNDPAGALEWFRFRDFPHFIEIYLGIMQSLRTSEDHERVVYEIGEDAWRQNIRYLEITFSPASPLNPRSTALPDVVLTGIRAGARRALRDFGVRMQFILDPVRTRSEEEVLWFARWCADNLGDGFVGFGLGGSEVGHPPERFAAAFDLVRDAGARISIHAGETVGPESVRAALAMGSERIGHGVRAIEDPELVKELADRGTVLEISPTSNICLGVYPSYGEHPFRTLHDAGVIVTVNSDDPPMFNTTLTNEYLVLAEHFGFSRAELHALSLRAVDAAFLPSAERDALAASFRDE
jgi:adenosine deaminase